MVYAAYSSNTNVASGSSSSTLPLGATIQDPFTLTLNDVIIRVPSQEHLNRLTAWLCRMSGAQASALNTLISTTFIAPEGLIDSFSDSNGAQSKYSFALSAQQWAVIYQADAADPTNTNVASGGSSSNSTLAFGATAQATHTLELGSMVIRAATADQIANLRAWLSHRAQVPPESVNTPNALRFISPDGFVNSILATRNGQAQYSFELSDQQWSVINQFNDAQYFGERIPSLAPGSGSYYSRNTSWNQTGVQLQAQLGGLVATAQQTYSANYSSTTLNVLQETQLNPNTLNLIKQVFGNVTINEGHLNVLKMMGLVEGNTQGAVSAWVLSREGATVLQALSQPANRVFVPATSLFNLDAADITLANGVPAYFNAQGGFQNRFTASDVEAKANQIFSSIAPPNTPMPSDITLGDRVASMLNSLFGLPANNTQFKAEQVNTAIAIGLIQRNPNNTSQLILTTNGNGYWSAKNPNTQPSTQTPPTSTQAQQVTEQDRADAFLAAVQSFPSWTSTITDRGMQRTIRLNAFDVLDSAHRGHGDGQFGSSDIDIVARRSGDTPSRRLAALARYAQQYGILDYIARNSGPGQRYSGVFNDGYIHRGMDNYVRSLPADRVTLVYTTAADGSVTITERR